MKTWKKVCNVIGVTLMTCTMFILNSTTCLAWQEVQMNDNYGASEIIEKYNQIFNYGNIRDTAGGVTGQVAGKDGVYTTFCRNEDAISLLCNKAGYITNIRILSHTRQDGMDETLLMIASLTNYEKPSKECTTAVKNAFSTGKPAIWYCDSMGRYYCVYAEKFLGGYSSNISAYLSTDER